MYTYIDCESSASFVSDFNFNILDKLYKKLAQLVFYGNFDEVNLSGLQQESLQPFLITLIVLWGGGGGQKCLCFHNNNNALKNKYPGLILP